MNVKINYERVMLMKLTLAEARLILANKEQELHDLFAKRKEARVNVYRKKDGQKELMHVPHEFTVDELTEKINKLQKEIRLLRLAVTKANIETLVDFLVDGKKITLQEAIYLIKQYREELPVLKEMGELKAKSEIVNPTARWGLQTATDSSYEQVTEPTYDTKKYRQLATKTETLITKLEVAINKANYSTMVDIEGVEINSVE